MRRTNFCAASIAAGEMSVPSVSIPRIVAMETVSYP